MNAPTGPSRSWRGARVRTLHLGAARVAAGVAIACFWAPLLQGLLSPVPPDRLPGWLRAALAATWDASTPFLTVAAACAVLAWALARGWGRTATVTVAPASLDVTYAARAQKTRGARTRSIPRTRIRSGIVRAVRAPDVELELSGGRLLRVQLGDEEDAHALVEALGLGSSERRARIPLGQPSQVVWRGIGALFGSIVLVFIVIGQVPRALLELFRDHLFLLWFLVMMAALHALRAPEITVGAEGIAIRTPWRRRYVAYAQIANVFAYDGGVFIARVDGSKIGVRGWSAESAQAVVKRVNGARAQAARAEAVHRTDWLERRGLSFADWRASLIDSLRPPSGYRAAAHAPEDAFRILEDATAPLEHRLGAALALAGSRQAGAPEKVRIAADACARDEVRIALACAAEDEPDEAAIEAALRG